MSTPGEDARTSLTRRALLAAGLGATVLGSAGASAATVTYRQEQGARVRAGAAAHRASMPTSTRVLWRPRTTERVVALTFDDGPDPRATPRVLDALRAAGVRATFFLIGRHATAHPDLVRRALDEGHELGNHTWTHPDLTTVSPGRVADELGRTQDLLAGLTGRPCTVLRPPFGRISGASIEAAAELGLDIALWEQRLQVKERDTAGNVAWVREHLGPGLVLLCHDGGPMARAIGIEALPAIIRDAQEQGYRFITATEAFALDGAGSTTS